MPEPLLAVLKLCALALLYLFFFRVLRAVWAEVNGPKVAAVPAGRAARGGRPPRRERRVTPRGRAERLVVVEPKDQKGRSYDLGDELTVGRAAGCQVTLEDSYVSQLHARVFARDGTLFVEDLGSTNGTYLNNAKVSAPVAMKRGDHLKIGSTVMEVGG
ncbi:MAG TPA: FHA domain-containing protein [Acidimicrobiales bacterium]|nr:FHA domain-containing protein [Acidimicrobiales bacterium]